MRLLDFAWSTFCSVSGADQSGFRLILSDSAQRPTVGLEGEGFVVKLPVPRREGEGLVSVQGLFADADDQGWPILWRLFKASLYHAAFHVMHPGIRVYSSWAKGKDKYAAVYAISLLEDYRVTLAAKKEWLGVMGDIAYANYLGAMRMTPLDEIESRGLRMASKLLLSLWGVSPQPGARKDEDREVLGLAERVRGMVENSLDDPQSPLLTKAADLVYKAFDSSVLPQIPSFPHTEAHSGDSLFGDHLVGSGGKDVARMSAALGALGVNSLPEDDESSKTEFNEALQAITDDEAHRQKVRDYYSKLLAGTRLSGVVVPQGDYSAFMRSRAELAGPIRNIKNQLMMVKNVTDEEQGKESGQIDMTMAMQVIASRSKRTDIFIREELLLKDEAWAILVDSSKSVSSSSLQIRGIATCLAEVASSLMGQDSKWGLFGFNDSFQVIKDFDERYTTEAKARIGGLSQQGATLLPDALVTAAKALGSRTTDTKYLVVVSDCLPTGYAGIEEELVARIDKVAKGGTLLIGIGVQSSAVKKYFKVNAELTSAYEMMKFFVRAYKELTPES